MMYGWYDGWGIGSWIVMGLMMLLFWGGIIALVMLLIRRGGTAGPGGAAEPHRDAERILNERFARGEIDEAEFTARRTALRRHE